MINWLAFNQDDSCLGVARDDSVTLYNCEPFGDCFEEAEGARVVEMLFSTSLIATVGTGYKPASSSRKLRIVNTKRGAVICELTFVTAILYIKMNRKRLIVALIDKIFVYDVSCMKLLHTIETESGGTVIADLSTLDNSILVYRQERQLDAAAQLQASNDGLSSRQGSATSLNSKATKEGSVVLFDALDLTTINVIECHKSPIRHLKLSKDGTLLATCSDKGTIIRVYSVVSGERLYEFRRGSYHAQVSCLEFKVDNSILVCSSNTGTVHLFRLDQRTSVPSQLPEPTNEQQSVDSSDEIPHKTMMTDEESLEINRLIESRIDESAGAKPSMASKWFNKGRKSTKHLGSYLLNHGRNYLPDQLNSMLEPKRDFAYIKLPKEVDSAVSIVGQTCYVATYSGDFYIYKVPSIQKLSPAVNDTNPDSSPRPGSRECMLLRQYHLDPPKKS